MDQTPAFKCLGDIFAEIKPYVKNNVLTVINRSTNGRSREENGTRCYCSIRDVHNSASATRTIVPTEALMTFMRTDMVLVNHDEIYFKVYLYENGSARVWAQYNQIIGSRLLAILTENEAKTFREACDAEK